MSSTDKARRQQAILEIVSARPIASQDELARDLGTRGHSVTQSTLSRDLRELRIFRVPVASGYRYLPAGDQAIGSAPAPSLRRVTAAEVVVVEANEVTAVVRTQVGRAPGVAAYLDGLQLPEVLATIAGDDTILVIPTTTRQTAALKRRLQEHFGLG